MRDELETHLAMMKRQGIITAWHDRRITAGASVDRTISKYLESSDVILLLVSPDFLASDYCYDIEVKRALERHEAGSAVVIPVILQPCDWLHSPLSSLRATPLDGKPVAKYANRNDAYLEVVADIRKAAEALGKDEKGAPPADSSSHAGPLSQSRSSNLRLKKTFSDRDRDQFVDEGVQYIRNYFESSLNELSARNPEIEHRLRDEGGTGFSAAIYVNGQKKASCRIWLGSRNGLGDICYSANDSSAGNSINDSMYVENDGYMLGLKPMGFGSFGNRVAELLSHQGAAEYYWSLLIAPLQ